MITKEVTASGKTVAEAQELARELLGAGPLDDVKFEVLHAGSRGIFGIIGVKPAKVRAYIEAADAPEKSERRRPERQKRAQKERQDRPEKQERASEGKNRKKKEQKKTEQKPESKETPKSAAVAEADLKLTRREVAEGEDMSLDFVKTLIRDIGLSAEAELYSCEDGTRRIIIAGDDASTLIGHHGDTLDALQYLANLASAKKNANGERDKSRVTIDIEGYRAKREETLRALARRMAAKALRNKRSVMLEPMSAYERRIIHSEVQGIEGVSTNSIGSDNNRKIVIYLTDKKPQEIFEEDADEAAEVETAEAAVETASESEELNTGDTLGDET